MKTLKSMRLHIGIFGKTNVGKSSFLNKITNQDAAIVSDIAGTTTDVIEKSMELLPIGPVTFLDTAGVDDKTDLGAKRLEKTKSALSRADIAVLICDYDGLGIYEKILIEEFNRFEIPFIIVVNKTDIAKSVIEDYKNVIYTSVFLYIPP